jgi:hypothetical protein
VVWRIAWHRIARRPYKQQNETRTRANHIMGRKSIPAEFLYNCPPSTGQANFEKIVTIRHTVPTSTENAKIPQIVTIRHNRPPIDSPVLRSGIGGMGGWVGLASHARKPAPEARFSLLC